MRSYSDTKDILELICSASISGNLGMFIGAGFTKAVLSDSDEYELYSWAELLKKCSKKMNIDIDIPDKNGDYPIIASAMCKQYSSEESINYEDAVSFLKNSIAEYTNIYPSENSIETYQEYFRKISIDWITTTNYDTVLESIFIGRCLPIGPDECFINVKDLVPIYHIHGLRTTPDSIVITQEDYTSLFRPNDYRQSRLPFLIKESIVLMIGYGLGDINVITAVDWSKNVFTHISENYDTEIIQLLYTENPKDKPYRDSSGVLIIEIDELSSFLDYLNEFYDEYSLNYEQKQNKVNDYISMFIPPNETNINKFIKNTDNLRKNTIKFIADLNSEFSYIYPNYISFLQVVIIELNIRSMPYGAFDAYDEKIKVLIDIFINLNIKKTPPNFFSLIAEAFDSVANYIDNQNSTYHLSGYAWKATKTWHSNKSDIPQEIIDELLFYSRSKKHHCTQLERLLKN